MESLFNNVSGLKMCNFIIKRPQHRFFPVTDYDICNISLFIEHLWWLLLKRSPRTLPQGFYILINVYKFFKFSTLESISQYANTSRPLHLHDICHGSAGREKQFSLTYQINWTKIHFYNLTSIAYSWQYGHATAEKYMPKVISGHIKFELPGHHEIIIECKLELLLFHILSAWVKHQMVVDIILQGFS